MNIIHLLSQNHLTGAEVYAVQLAHEQIKNNHEVHQLSNGFFSPTSAQKQILEVETKSKWTFLNNILKLRAFIKKHQIHIVHSHSRAAAKLAFYSTLFSKTAHVSSVHGQQHPSFSKKLMNQYGEFIIAVCLNVKKHLVQDFSYNTNRIKVLPNPIAEELFYFGNHSFNFSEKIKVAVVGRTTGPKGTRTEQVIKALFSDKFRKYNLQISVVGGKKEDLDLGLDQHQHSLIQETPIEQLNSAAYDQFDLIIGSGRVCMESLITGIPTLAFGEAEYVGLINEQNFELAQQSNFGDISPYSNWPRLDENKFVNELTQHFDSQITNNSHLKKLSEITATHFSLKTVYSQVLRVYESAYFLKNNSRWIPILMYHKIPKKNLKTQHKIFVTQENFEKHLQFFKRKGFTTLTFSELALYRKGLMNFKNFPKKPLILTFDDGYRDNLENASPLLKKYGFKAQIFLLADKEIDSNVWDHSETEPAHEIVSGEERQKWKNSAFEVGSHGFSHAKLTSLSKEESKKELADSKKKLEAEFQQEVNVFAFTYGITTEASRTLAEQAGYDYAVNTDTGGLLIEEDPYAVFRVNIFPDESYWSLLKKTSGWYRRYYNWKRKK